MTNPENPDGIVDPVRVQHLYDALANIEEWLGAVRQVLGRLDPDTIVPPGEDQAAFKRVPCPIPIVDSGLCKNLWLSPKPCPDPETP